MFKESFSPCRELPETVEYFKEELIEELLVIPDQKPDIERILDILVWADVVDYKLIETEKGVANSGQKLSGLKLIVKIRLKEKVMYVADVCTQAVHAAHYEAVKNIFIVLPEKINGEDTCTLVKRKKISIQPYVEGVDFRALSERCIQKCVMLLVEAKNI